MDQMPAADVHSHLGTGRVRQARTLADIVSYHWLSVELARAKRTRIEADPVGDPGGYVREVLPFFPAIRNTVNHYAFMGMLRDLYGIEDRTLTPANWERADAAVRQHAGDAGWIKSVLDRARVERITVCIQDGMPDSSSRYVPYVYGEFLFAPTSLNAIRAIAGEGNELPQTPDELAAAIGKRVDQLVADQQIRALHVWYRGTWSYAPPEPAKVAELLQRVLAGGTLSQQEEDVLVSYGADAMSAAAGRHRLVVQLFHGSIAYTRAGVTSYWNPEFLRSLTRHFHDHPDTLFDLFLSTRIPSHEAAAIARVYPNLMVSGAWWQGFTPSTMLAFFRDRLELLPNTAWNAFYSDGYIVEWVYAKLLVTKNRLAQALAEMTVEGFITEDDAIDIARRLLYDNAVAAYRM
jgi:hypothetical protein